MSEKLFHEKERAILEEILDELDKEKSFFSFRTILKLFKADSIAHKL